MTLLWPMGCLQVQRKRLGKCWQNGACSFGFSATAMKTCLPGLFVAEACRTERVSPVTPDEATLD